MTNHLSSSSVDGGKENLKYVKYCCRLFNPLFSDLYNLFSLTEFIVFVLSANVDLLVTTEQLKNKEIGWSSQ